MIKVFTKPFIRLAFVCDIKKPNTPDIVFFKLGVQSEYGRNESQFSEWEKTEREICQSLPALSGLRPMNELPNPTGSEVTVAHFGNNHPAELPFSHAQQFSFLAPFVAFHDQERCFEHQSYTRPGSSGSPVVLYQNDQLILRGVTFK